MENQLKARFRNYWKWLKLAGTAMAFGLTLNGCTDPEHREEFNAMCAEANLQRGDTTASGFTTVKDGVGIYTDDDAEKQDGCN